MISGAHLHWAMTLTLPSTTFNLYAMALTTVTVSVFLCCCHGTYLHPEERIPFRHSVITGSRWLYAVIEKMITNRWNIAFHTPFRITGEYKLIVN